MKKNTAKRIGKARADALLDASVKRLSRAATSTKPARAKKTKPGAGKKPGASPHTTPSAEEIFASLPLKQQTFINTYLANGFNATQAAKDAGYSAATADSQASRLLKNAKVHAVIAERTKAGLEKLEITADRVKNELASIAFGGMVYEPKDRLKGLELLGRHFKMFVDRTEAKVTIERVVVREALQKERPLPPAAPDFGD